MKYIFVAKNSYVQCQIWGSDGDGHVDCDISSGDDGDTLFRIIQVYTASQT
jgi:hypothetical protein